MFQKSNKVLNIFEKRLWLYGCRSVQSKKEIHSTRNFIPMYEKKIRIQKENRTKLAFRPQQKNWHNRTTVLYTKYISNTKNNFLPEQKKLTQHHNCMVL